MRSQSLPPELLELEGRLRGRSVPMASDELRSRVLGGVGLELASGPRSPLSGASGVRSWGVIAAAAIVAMNVSVIDRSRMEFSGRAGPGPWVGWVYPPTICRVPDELVGGHTLPTAGHDNGDFK